MSGNRPGVSCEFFSFQRVEQQGKKYCQSRQIREDVLIKTTNELMGYVEFDENDLRSKVELIEAFNGNRLVYHFKDGTEKETFWQDPKRSDGWTPEKREKARQAAIKQNQKKGANGQWVK